MNNQALTKYIPAVAYNVLVQTYTAQEEIAVQDFCNGVSIRNLGDTPLTINGIRLNPSLVAGQIGEQTTWGGNLGEIYRGRLTLIFLAPIGVNPLCEIIQKFYVDETR